VPTLKLPDGAELYWEERGEGPLVVIASYWSTHPSVFEPLTEELVSDHRVVRYDDRGAGQSSSSGPFDMETAADDLEAVTQAAGPEAVIVATADGCNRAVRVAARRRDLVAGVVIVGGAPVTRESFQGSEAMISSDVVVNAFFEMVGTDYRGALRSVLGATNEQMDEDELRERVRGQAEYSPAAAAVPRLRAWMDDAAAEESARLAGDRLWFLRAPQMGGGWFPQGEEYERLIVRTFPEARIDTVDDGFVSRPDQTAAVVRRITASSRAAAGRP
jgi:pimeloyl-ACP methyl ester carboxylesterase